jgi:enoyl-CoA hydratase/carnithine racemase
VSARDGSGGASPGTPIGVERSDDGRVATVTLNRPEQRNALTLETLDALTDAFGGLAASSPVPPVVVLAGAGSDFCSGADLGAIDRARTGAIGRAAADFDGPFRDALRAIATYPMPVVARVQGRALGGGCQLVLACDLAVAAPDAVLGIPSARLGIVIPFASVQRLVLAVGPRRSGEMLYAARTVSGVEAADWGLVTAVAGHAELDRSTHELVERVTGSAPLSVRASKRGIGLAIERMTQDLGEPGGTTDFDLMLAEALASEDLGEGIAAFRERRPPRFQGR